MAKTFLVSPGRSYTVTASIGSSVKYPNNSNPIATIGSEGSVTFNCTGTEITVSDDNAKIAQNFNNAGAAVAGAGGGSGLTADQIELLTLYASSEGRNVPISEDGEIVTQVGHTYTITAGEMPVKCTDADFNPLCEVAAHKQMSFVAPSTAAYVDPVTCTVTEVFRAAAPVELSGNGGGESGGEATEPEYDLPEGYIQLDYLQASGEQYIDSGVQPSGDLKVVLDTELLEKYIGTFFGGRNIADNNANLILYELYNPRFQFDYGTTIDTDKNAAILQPNKKYRFDIVYGKITINDISLSADFYKSFNGDINIYVFAFNKKGEIGYYAKNIRIHYLKFSYSDDIQREFIPALDETGAPCMFDLVEQKAYYNSGTGDFLYPTESTTFALRRVLPDWGKLTEHGLRRLYHAPEGYTGELIDYALENGYKPIVEPEMPADGYWTPQWRETEEEIVLEWIETEEPETEAPEMEE